MTFSTEPKAGGNYTEEDRSAASLRSRKNDEHHGQSQMPGAGEGASTKTSGKSLSFYLAFLALNMSVFIVSLDVTAIPVALPVCVFRAF